MTREELGGRVLITRLERGGPASPFVAEDHRGLIAWPAIGEAFEYLHVVEFAAAGVRRGLHTHAGHEESFLVFRGSIRLVVAHPSCDQPAAFEVGAGDLVRLAPGVAHALQSLLPALTVHFGRGTNPLLDSVPAHELADWL